MAAVPGVIAALCLAAPGTAFTLPDVVVDSIALSPANPAAGQPVSFTAVVRNAGPDATPSGVQIGVGYRIDGVQRTWGVVNGPLPAGAKVTVGTNGGSWYALSGAHTLTAVADDINRFAEANESNNTRSVSFTVGSSTPPPTTSGPTGEPTVLSDGTLQWQSEDYTGGTAAASGVDYYDSTSGNSGGAYRTHNVDIQACSEGGYNVGWTAAGEWLRYKFTGGGSYQISVRYAAIAAATVHIEVDGANVSGAIALPSTGGWQTWATATGKVITLASAAHTVRFVTDSANFNVNYFRFKPSAPPATGQPDVVVDSVTLSPANPAAGQPVTFTSIVRNAGTAATPSGVQIGVSYRIDGVQRTWGLVNGPLAAGATVTVGTSGGAWYALSGAHTLTAVADDVNRFAESNETNNTRSVSFTVGSTTPPPGQPDVVVSSVTLSPSNPATGQAVTFSAVVKNIGTGSTPSGVQIGVGYRIDGAQKTWGAVAGPLAAGASVTVSTQGGAWSAVSGTHTLTAMADDINRFAESNEGNNVSAGVLFTVGSTTPPPPPPPPPGTITSRFGINIDPANPAGNPSVQALKTAGARWVRIEWKNTQSQAYYDSLISAYRAAGLKVLVILDYSSISGRVASGGSDSDWLAYIGRFATFCGQTAAHYGNGVDAWQIWNEQDHLPKPGYDPYVRPALYGRLLRDAYNAIKPYSSSPVVTGGSASGSPTHLQQARDAVGGLYADAVAIHPYGKRAPDNWPDAGWGFGNMSESINVFYNTFGKKIWITEIGLATGNGDRNFEAQYLQNVYDLTGSSQFKDKVPVVFWFCWSDGMVAGFGILDAGGGAKPAYYKYQSVAGSW